MPQQTFSVSENVKIQIRACQNRVTVVGWDDARTVAADYAARQEGDTIFVENASKVTLRVPRSASVTISDCEADVRVDDLAGHVELVNIGGDVALRNLRGETIARDVDGALIAKGVVSLRGEGKWKGDVALRDVKNVQTAEVEGAASVNDVDTAVIRELEGDLVAKQVKSLKGKGTWEGDAVLRSVESAEIEEIEGDASLGDVGTITIQTLGGDLAAQGVRGALTVDEVKGDVSLRDVGGRVALEHVGGDFIASGVRDAVSATDIEGDAIVSFDTVAGLTLCAEGDVVINLPEKADAEVVLDAPRGDLVARAGIKVIEEDESHLRGTIGNGGVKIQAESTNGDLIVRQSGTITCCEETEPHGRPFARMGQQIAAEVRQSVRESLGDMRFPEGHHRRHFAFRIHRHDRRHDYEPEPREERVEEKPRGPGAGSPERKAILDAIARGELSVDDAIKKLTGED